MTIKTLVMLMALVLVLTAQSSWATGMRDPGPCVARNEIEAYCVNHGGCPKDGNCYFPDGSYCDLLAFYKGTCPGRGYYEQAIWMSEAYRFLYGDFYSPYMPSYMPTAMPNYYWPNYYGPGYYGPGYSGYEPNWL